MMKATIGRSLRYRWSPPVDGAITGDITLTVEWPAGVQTYTLALVRAADTITAIDAGRTVFSATWGASGAPSGTPTHHQPASARLVGAGVAEIPVRVVRMVSTAGLTGTVEIAERVPHDVTISGLSLHWQDRAVSIPSGHIPATPTRAVGWYVDATITRQGASEEIRDRGVLRVVRMPFRTGLTEHELVELVPDLRQRNAGHASWERARTDALEALEVLIAPRIGSRVVDQLSGRQFVRAHAYLTASVVLLGRTAADAHEASARYRAAAIDEITTCLASPEWVDDDDDGAVDAGEAAGRAVRSASVRLSTASPTTATWTTPPATPYEAPIYRTTDDR